MAKVLGHTVIGVVVGFEGPSFARLPHDSNLESIRKIKERQRADFSCLVRCHVTPHMKGDFSFQEIFREHHKCSACGNAWTENSNTYNGGCCEADEANNPEPRP